MFNLGRPFQVVAKIAAIYNRSETLAVTLDQWGEGGEAHESTINASALQIVLFPHPSCYVRGAIKREVPKGSGQHICFPVSLQTCSFCTISPLEIVTLYCGNHLKFKSGMQIIAIITELSFSWSWALATPQLTAVISHIKFSGISYSILTVSFFPR